ncbi:hypothetical protein TNCV_254521 [Trichonephila clavipes]|nr:hypothetical protein TNCV_254521 [Trichonephila clavipes]
MYRVSGLKVSKSYGFLILNYPSECNKVFIRVLETPYRFFGSNPTDHTCSHLSAIAEDKFVTLTSLVKMWTPQQKLQCGGCRRRLGMVRGNQTNGLKVMDGRPTPQSELEEWDSSQLVSRFTLPLQE